MTLISPDLPCAICGEPLLDDPYEVLPGVWLLLRSRLAGWERAPLHLECIGAWKHRGEVARLCFVDRLAARWCTSDNLLAVKPGWFLTAKPGELVALFRPDEPVWIPGRVTVRLATWPCELSSTWDEWDVYVRQEFRRGLAASVLAIVEPAMAEVRELAPSVEALATLHTDRPKPTPGERSLGEFGDFLARLWGEAAYEWDWELLERERREMRQAEADQRQALDERTRRRAKAVVRSNEIAQLLAADLVTGRPLRCPHCRRSTREMRFFDLAPRARSYFVCRRCGGSFAGREAEGDE